MNSPAASRPPRLAQALRHGFPEKSAKDHLQAATLAAMHAEYTPESPTSAFDAMLEEIKCAATSQMAQITKLLARHAEAQMLVGQCFAG